jgi:uncharacterized repeat protein (TIGR01451 family)
MEQVMSLGTQKLRILLFFCFVCSAILLAPRLVASSRSVAESVGHDSPAQLDMIGLTGADSIAHQYFVPFDDDDLWTLFAEINDDGAIGQCLFDSSTSSTLNSFISVTSSSDGTILYYDHWEDGYDTDPLVPGPTTEVGVIDAGVTQTFNDLVATPRVTATLLYDGRDRITVLGEPVSVIRAVYPVAPGEVLAGAWEVPEVSDWGQSFVAVIGEDLDFNGAGVADDFDYVGLQIMAAQANTQIWVNGTLVTTTVRAGATFFIDGENNGPGFGGVDSGDVITATAPIQVQMLGAACDQPLSARAYTLQPVDTWYNNYWAPVPDFTEEATWCAIDQDVPPPIDDRDTDLYIHNPHPYPITVTFDDGGVGAPIPLTVPPTTTISILAILNNPATFNRDLNDTMGAHLYGDETFWGMSVIDSISGNTAVQSTSQVNDWGYSLIPVNKLSSQVILGWAPGNSLPRPTGDDNGSLAFVSALTDTVIYVDFAQDGLPDAFDINGDGDADDFDVFFNPNFDEPTSDDGVSLVAGQVLRVADPNDNDLTGAIIYALDLGNKIAVAWGQDPCRADRALPFLDMGYTVLPHPIPSLSKESELAVDADMTGDVSPGDTISYTIVLHNNGLGPLTNAVLTDTIPYIYTDFIVGSLVVSEPPVLGGTDYYNGISWGYPPVANPEGVDPAVQAFRLAWSVIGAGETVTISFRVLLDEDIPPEVEEISNQATFSSDDTGTTISRDPNDPLDPDTDVSVGQPILQIHKIDEPDPVRPGQLLTYTIVATNTGNGAALSALLLEDLPPYATYVSNTLNLTLPSVVTELVTRSVPYTTTFTGSYADDFDLTIAQNTGYTGSDGSLAWLTDWTEVGDPTGPGPAAGDVQVGSTGAELSTPGYLELTDNDDLDSGVIRSVDLSGFISPTLSFYVSGVSGAGDTYDVRVNGGSIPGFPEPYNGPYQQRTRDLSAFVSPAPVTLEFIGQANMEPADTYRVDNIVIYEASPLRSGTHVLEETVSTLTYTTRSGINPLSYDRVANTMTVTDAVRIPPGAQVSFNFQVLVDIPLPNGMVLLNTAAITSSNLVTIPFPLEDDEPTTVVSSHALTITKSGVPDTAYIGQWLTYTLFWEVGGDEPAPGVVVTDTIPWPYVSFVGCDGGFSCSSTAPDTIVWELGDRLPIASGITYDSGWLTATVRVEGYPPGGVFTNTVIIDDATDTPTDEDDESTNVIDAGFVLNKQRITPSPIDLSKDENDVQFLIVITNTGALTITRLPLEDTYDPVYLEYRDALPLPSATSPGVITWDDLTLFLPDATLPPGESIRVWVQFEALTNTQHLTPPVTINTAVSNGAEAGTVQLPLVQDSDDVEIEDSDITAIELLYFNASPKAGGVLVKWRTLFEINTYGFWLYRSDDADLNHAIPVTFVAGKGGHSFGATYQYLDTDLPPGLYHYWLVEVENSGKETTFGPVTASPGWDPADLPHRIYLPLVRWKLADR